MKIWKTRIYTALALLLITSFWAVAQQGGGITTSIARHIRWGASLPATCQVGSGDVFFKTSATVAVYFCSATNTWTAFGTGSGSGTVTSIATTSPITGGTITTTGTIACATCVTSSSPGVGIAHFAGSTQAVTSSLIVNADITNSTIDLTAKVTGLLPAANIVANVRVRAFGYAFGDTAGAALTAGSVGYFTVPYACTISAWNINVDAGTATFDIWKIATGSAIPTVSNSITASAQPAIASGTSIHSTTMTGWGSGVNVSANDIFGIQLKTVATAKFASLQVECDQ